MLLAILDCSINFHNCIFVKNRADAQKDIPNLMGLLGFATLFTTPKYDFHGLMRNSARVLRWSQSNIIMKTTAKKLLRLRDKMANLCCETTEILNHDSVTGKK